MSKSTLYLMCGLPFSGKTTLAHALADRYGFVHLDLDALARARSLFPDEGVRDEQWGEIFDDVYQQVAAILAGGESVVVDAVNYDRAGRDRFRTIAQQSDSPFYVIFINLSLQEIERRRQANQATPVRPPVRQQDFVELATEFEVPIPKENLLIYDGTQSIPEWIETHKGM
jgi:predicted kinase